VLIQGSISNAFLPNSPAAKMDIGLKKFCIRLQQTFVVISQKIVRFILDNYEVSKLYSGKMYKSKHPSYIQK
jgi:hypothetical protein